MVCACKECPQVAFFWIAKLERGQEKLFVQALGLVWDNAMPFPEKMNWLMLSHANIELKYAQIDITYSLVDAS